MHYYAESRTCSRRLNSSSYYCLSNDRSGWFDAEQKLGSTCYQNLASLLFRSSFLANKSLLLHESSKFSERLAMQSYSHLNWGRCPCDDARGLRGKVAENAQNKLSVSLRGIKLLVLTLCRLALLKLVGVLLGGLRDLASLLISLLALLDSTFPLL